MPKALVIWSLLDRGLAASVGAGWSTFKFFNGHVSNLEPVMCVVLVCAVFYGYMSLLSTFLIRSSPAYSRKILFIIDIFRLRFLIIACHIQQENFNLATYWWPGHEACKSLLQFSFLAKINFLHPLKRGLVSDCQPGLIQAEAGGWDGRATARTPEEGSHIPHVVA